MNLETDISVFIFSTHYNDRNINSMLKIPKVVKGMSVACPAYNLWHRAEVLKIIDFDALVYFVDTGSTSYVNVTKLRYLENSFGSMSRKCCKGSLFGVKPKNDALWQAGAIMDFMERVNKSQVYATVRAISEQVYELVLTSDLKDYTLISGFLVLNKYAECVAGLDHSINQVLVSLIVIQSTILNYLFYYNFFRSKRGASVIKSNSKT